MARGLHRLRAPGGAVELLPVLLGRGRGRRQPVPVHRRRAAGGAEVLPDDPAGRRGPPRGVLQALHAGGLRDRRRLDGERAAGDQAAADCGLPQDLRPARPDGRRAARRPLAGAAGGRRDALPHRHRGGPRPARPALHLRLPGEARPAARLPRGHAEHRRRRAAPHRLRREAAVGPQPRRPGGRAQGRRRAAPRRHPLHGPGADAAGLGRALHHGLRRRPSTRSAWKASPR